MKKLILIAAVAAVAASCSNKNACTINGFGEKMAGYVYLVDYANPAVVLDSAKVVKDKFKFTVDAQTHSIAAVRGQFEAEETDNNTENSNGLYRMVDNNVFYRIVMVEPGNVVVDVNNSITSGTPSNDAYCKMTETRDALIKEYYASETPEQREALSDQLDAMTGELLEANGDNIFGAMMLNEMSYEMAGANMLKVIDAFPEAVRNSAFVGNLREQAQAKLHTDPGQPYIEVVQPDMNGKEVSLSSVVENPKNKYVLVDFWASWCGPCMGEVPYLIETYAKYHDKGFEIFGISHDTDGDRWRNCVKDRGMKWIHVSELHRFDNQAAKDYCVRAIPANFLVETATGKILASNLRGKALEEKIAELLD